MTVEHWLDTLGKQMARRAPRRQVLRSAALAAGLARGGAPAAAAAPCERRACAKQWPGKGKVARHNRASCEATCQRCKRTKTAFCIVEGDPNNPAKVADCCAEDEQCCQATNSCCPEDFVCCPAGNHRHCCPRGEECCEDSARGCCAQNQECCPGRGCFDTSSDNRACGDCDTICPNGSDCVDGTCRCPNGDEPCGGQCCPSDKFCDRGTCYCQGWGEWCRDARGSFCCPYGYPCVGGKCQCPPEYPVVCPSLDPRIDGCYSEGWTCCGSGACDPDTVCSDGTCCYPGLNC